MIEVNEKDLINLKEAAKITGYTADYIGQLIRAGKIPGKQVYCNVQWMTTEKAVLEYKKNGGTKKQSKAKSNIRKIGMEMNILKLFFKTFKMAMPIFLLIIILTSLFFGYLIAAVSEFGQEKEEGVQMVEVVTF